jgi:hypothetical protein
MSKHEDLMIAIMRNDLESALYETGDLLRKGATEMLETTWIYTLARVAENVRLPHVGEYQRCIMTLKKILDDEEIRIKDAFLFTVRLSFLSSKYTCQYARPTIGKLKEKVIMHFPEGATLSPKGAELFQSILPPKETDEHAFLQRILAGLSKLWAQEQWDDVRLAMEYLSRKRLAVPKPKWIMPNVVDDGDITWVLWGAVLLYFSKDPIVATIYHLFTFHFKKGAKSDRLGLLWSVSYIHSCSYNEVDTWTLPEKTMYQHIENNVQDLWNQLQPEDVLTEQSCVEFWHQYMPRGLQRAAYSEPFKEEKRTLRIKGNKDIKETSGKVNKVLKANEADHSDSWYRGLYLSKQKPTNPTYLEQ